MATNTKRSGARRKPQPKAAQETTAPRWVWFVSGLLPGLFIAFLVHTHHQQDGGIVTATSPEDGAERDSEGGDGDDSGRPRFEFYELLSEMEVVVPDESDEEDVATPLPDEPVGGGPPVPESSAPDDEPDPAADAPAEELAEDTPEPEVTPDDGGRYMVQAGSFQSHDDADQLKARLALMGVQADIQSVEVDGGETWHRVRIGPFSDRDRVESIRSRLQDENLDSILLRMRG